MLRWFVLFAAGSALVAIAAAGVYKIAALSSVAKIEHAVPQAAKPLAFQAIPGAPAVAESAERIRPSFDVALVQPDGSAVFAGRAKPDALIELLANGHKLTEATANEDGEWALVLDRPLGRGDHLVTLRARTADGGEAASAQSLAVGISSGKSPRVDSATADTTSRVLQAPPAGSAGRELGATELAKTASQVGVLREPVPPTEVGKSLAAPISTKSRFVIRSVDYQESGRLLIAGEAQSGARLRAYLNDTYVGEGISADAKFTFSLNTDLSSGRYRIRVDDIEPRTGSVLKRVETHFERDAPTVRADGKGDVARAGQLAKADEPQVVSIRHGDRLWEIARKKYGQGQRYTMIYEANAEQIRNPGRIYPKQIFIVPRNEAQ